MSLGSPSALSADDLVPASAARRATALARFSAARQAEAAGDMRLALQHYRELLRSDPGQADLARKAAELALTFGAPGEAEAMLDEATRSRPDDPSPRIRLVEFLDAYRDDEVSRKQADEAMADVVRLFPHRADVISSAALRSLVQGNRAAAMDLLNQAAQQTGGSARHWLDLAGAAQEVWPLGQAELADEHRSQVNRFYEKALRMARQSDETDIELDIGQFFLLSNQLDSAETIFKRLADENNSLAARKILFRLYEARDRKDEAFALLQSIVADDPSDVTQRRLLAAQMEERQLYPEAAKELEAAIQIGGGTAEDYDKLANLWLGLRETDRALTMVDRAIRLFPEIPNFHAQKAMAFSVKGDQPRAVESFAAADQLSSASGVTAFNHRFYFRYGVALERAARFEDAARQFERSISATPKEEVGEIANTLNYLGYMWLEQGKNLEKAGEFIQKANELEPNNPAFIDSMGWFYHKTGRHQEALEELRLAEELLKEIQPEDAEILEHIGLVQAALGQRAEAIETLKRADALKTPDEKVAKRIDEALKRLQKEKSAPPAEP